MKKGLLIFTIVLALSCCNNDDNPQNPIDQLPPMTTTGANTFGALLDGEPFLPSGGTNPLDCVYQFVNGEYFFSLQGNNRDKENNGRLIGVSTNNLQIIQNQEYFLQQTQ